MILEAKFRDNSLSKFSRFEQKVSALNEETGEIENIDFVKCYATWLKDRIYAVTNMGIEILITHF